MDVKERTLNKVNKITRVFGLPLLHLVLLFAVVVVLGLNLPLSLIVIFPLCFIIIKNMKSADKEGNPDYIGEQMNKLNQKTSFDDLNDVMRKIYCNE